MPEAFANVAPASWIVTANREVAEVCIKRANEMQSTATYTIRVEPRRNNDQIKRQAF